MRAFAHLALAGLRHMFYAAEAMRVGGVRCHRRKARPAGQVNTI
jgi:hypothetical protein